MHDIISQCWNQNPSMRPGKNFEMCFVNFVQEFIDISDVLERLFENAMTVKQRKIRKRNATSPVDISSSCKSPLLSPSSLVVN